MSTLTIFHVTNISSINMHDKSNLLAFLPGQRSLNAILISGVSATGVDEYLRAAFRFRQLAENLQVPFSNVLVVPSLRDMAQLRSFSEAFYAPVFGEHFSPCVPKVVTLGRLQLISLNAIQQGQSIGIGEQLFLDMSRSSELANATTATRLLLTNIPFGRWSVFPKMGLSEWTLKHRLFEITTEAVKPPLPSIRQFVTESGTLQLLNFEADTGFLLGQTYRRIFGNWELVDAQANPRRWEAHFSSLVPSACYSSRQVSSHIAIRAKQWDGRKKFLAVMHTILLLKGRLVLSFPSMKCIDSEGAPICADSLDLSGDTPEPAYYGWRWVEALLTFPAFSL